MSPHSAYWATMCCRLRTQTIMNEALVITLLVVSIFGFLACGVWVGLTLAGTAWLGMQFFSARPAGDAMAITIWGAASSWTLTALPLFLWMGEILFRSRLSRDLFTGLAPWFENIPGRMLHTNRSEEHTSELQSRGH